MPETNNARTDATSYPRYRGTLPQLKSIIRKQAIQNRHKRMPSGRAAAVGPLACIRLAASSSRLVSRLSPFFPGFFLFSQPRCFRSHGASGSPSLPVTALVGLPQESEGATSRESNFKIILSGLKKVLPEKCLRDLNHSSFEPF
jgi:hypothetical protein